MPEPVQPLVPALWRVTQMDGSIHSLTIHLNAIAEEGWNLARHHYDASAKTWTFFWLRKKQREPRRYSQIDYNRPNNNRRRYNDEERR